MLLKDGEDSFALGATSPLSLTPQRRWQFHIEPVIECDIEELVDITLEAFKDDAMVNGCFREGTDLRVRREQEMRWRVSELIFFPG